MRLLTTLLLATLLAAVAFSQEGARSAPTEKKAQESAEEWLGEPYTLETCAASGRPIDVKGTPRPSLRGPRAEVLLQGCADYVKKNPAKFLGKVDEQLIAQQKPIYPTGKCLVAGKPSARAARTPGST